MSRFFHLLAKLLFLLNKQLKMCSLHMNIHEIYTISFVVFNLTLTKSKYLYENFIRSLFKFTNYALQHCVFTKSTSKLLLQMAKHPQQINIQLCGLQVMSCASTTISCKTSTFDMLTNCRCTLSTFDINEDCI